MMLNREFHSQKRLSNAPPKGEGGPGIERGGASFEASGISQWALPTARKKSAASANEKTGHGNRLEAQDAKRLVSNTKGPATRGQNACSNDGFLLSQKE